MIRSRDDFICMEYTPDDTNAVSSLFRDTSPKHETKYTRSKTRDPKLYGGRLAPSRTDVTNTVR
jgi:hypothetical protein